MSEPPEDFLVGKKKLISMLQKCRLRGIDKDFCKKAVKLLIQKSEVSATTFFPTFESYQHLKKQLIDNNGKVLTNAFQLFIRRGCNKKAS